MQAIREGVNSDQYFALAAGFDGTRYIDLMFSRSVSYVDKSALLVKMSVAQTQIAAEEAKRQAEMDAAASGSDHTVAPYGNNGHGDMTDGSADTAHGGVADGSSPYGPSRACGVRSCTCKKTALLPLCCARYDPHQPRRSELRRRDHPPPHLRGRHTRYHLPRSGGRK